MEFTEQIKKVFYNNSIEILKYKNEKNPIKYKCLVCGKEYEYKCARNLFSKISLCNNCYEPFKRWNKERLQQRLSQIFVTSDIEVLSFTSMRKGGQIKCCKCGEIENINNFSALLVARKNNFCNNCEKDKNIIYNHLQEELEKGQLKLIEWNGVNNKNKFQCLKCGCIFNKKVTLKFSGKICPNCSKVVNKFSLENAQKLLDIKGQQEYKLLQYKGMNNKSLIKHQCGFCFTTRLSDFEKTRGCPKCYRKISKGKQKIMNFLNINNYNYIYQKRFKDLEKFSFDFCVFLNNKMILLDFQGQQHYKEIEIFDNLYVQQKRDKIKKDYCLANNIPLIEIPYWEIENIEKFLQLKFNDYLVRE